MGIKEWNKWNRKRSIRRTGWWLLGNSLFGVAPVILLWATKHCTFLKAELRAKLNDIYTHVIDDGALNFFFLAIIGASTIDIILAKKDLPANFTLGMVIAGIASAFLILFIYAMFLMGGDEHYSFGRAKGLTIAIGVFALGFCSWAKYNLTLREVGEYKD